MKAGLDFAKHAIAITGEGSKLDTIAVEENWLYPLTYVGLGWRTYFRACTVGLLPAALQGINIVDLLNGAKAMDALHESRNPKNPAAYSLSLVSCH